MIVGVATLTALVTAIVIATASSAIVIGGIGSGFEDNDGNLAPGDGTNINFDWNSFATVSWTGTPPDRTATKTVSGWTFNGFEDAQKPADDNGFGGGAKQDDVCPRVNGTGTAANKDDLKRIYIAHKTGSNGHIYLTLAWVRIPQNTTSSSAHVAFEFDQNKTPVCSNSDLVERSTANHGDMLIVYNFEGGSGFPTILLERWINSTGTNPPDCEISTHTGKGECWSKAVNLTASGVAEANVDRSPNSTSVHDGIAPTPEDVGDSEFGEAGVDLTAAGVFTANQCTGFGKVDAVSRTSGDSANAQMDDLVGPGDIDIHNCGSILIKKQSTKLDSSSNNLLVGGASFTITGTGGTTGTFNVTDNLGASTNPARLADQKNTTAGIICVDNIPSGTYSITESAAPTGYAKDSSTVTNVSPSNTSCADRSATSTPDATFTDTPLSTIEVKFTSLAGTGVTSSQITCAKVVNSTTSTTVAPTSENGSADDATTPVFDDTDETYGNGTSTLVPGTYNCQVIIDP